MSAADISLKQVDAWRWRIPKTGAMRVDGMVYADEKMSQDIRRDQSLQQVVNVAALPGIRGASMAMPDIHGGMAFPSAG